MLCNCHKSTRSLKWTKKDLPWGQGKGDSKDGASCHGVYRMVACWAGDLEGVPQRACPIRDKLEWEVV